MMGALESKYIDCGAYVRRHDTPTIMDGLVVRYELTGRAEISASRNGVAINYVMVHSDGRKRFATILEWAFKQHDRLAEEYRRKHAINVEAIPQEQLGTIRDDEEA